MSSILISSALVKTIKRRGFIPNSQETFTTDDLLEMATEEVNIGLMDQIMLARGDYLVDYVDIPMEDGVTEYPVPARAHANKLREASIVNANGEIVHELSQISLEEVSDFEDYYAGQSNDIFYMRNNFVVITSSNVSEDNFIRMWFYMRPNKLVQDARAGIIRSYSTVYEQDTISPKSGSITNISVADPTIITSTAHGLTSGEYIVISGSDSTPSIDGTKQVTVIDANSFSIDVNVTVSGSAGSWNRAAECVVISMTTMPKHFSSEIRYDFVGANSPNKIKLYDLTPNNVNSTLKTVSFKVADLKGLTLVGDYITKAEETIVPNLPTEFHPVLAQRVAVACLEAMGDEQNKQSAERKLKQMETSVLRMFTNRVEGAPKKIRNRNGTLNQAVRSHSTRKW